MNLNRSVRLAACAAMAGSAALAVVAPGAMAGAKSPKPDKVVCSSFSGDSSSQTISGCTGGPAGINPGTSVPTSTGTTGSATVTWADGKTSVESYSYALKTGKADKCPAITGDTSVGEVKEKGTVTGGTETALVGGKVKSTVCVYSTSSGISLSLFPGTTLAI
jgi:hypothetical protein